jgi:hypothetical protein
MHQAIATVAEDNARLSCESNSMCLNNQNLCKALCLLTDNQNDDCIAPAEMQVHRDSRKVVFNLSVMRV